MAGTGLPGSSGDGGPATAAQLNFPFGVAPTADGGVLIADTGNARVRYVTAAGTITTVAGTGTEGFSGDGGPATAAQLNGPYGVAVTADGGVVVADDGNSRVRLVDLGPVTAVMGLSLSTTTVKVGDPVTATLAGEVLQPAYVDTYLETIASGCAPTSAAEKARVAADYLGRATLAAGTFTKSQPVPSNSPGASRVCAYLYDSNDDGTGPPLVLRDATLTVLGIQLSLSTMTATVGDVITATLTGAVVQPAYIDTYLDEDASSCAPTSEEEDARDASDYLGTIMLPAGPFASSQSVPSDFPGAYRVCAYLYDSDDGTGPPLALREATLTVRELAPPPTPRPAGGALSLSPPSVRATDKTPPTVRLAVAAQRLRTVLAKGLKVTVSTSEPGRVCGFVTVNARTRRILGLRASPSAKRVAAYELGHACAKVSAPGRGSMQVRFTRKAVRALRKRVRRHRGVAVQVAATARDRSQNVTTSPTKTVLLRS